MAQHHYRKQCFCCLLIVNVCVNFVPYNQKARLPGSATTNLESRLLRPSPLQWRSFQTRRTLCQSLEQRCRMLKSRRSMLSRQRNTVSCHHWTCRSSLILDGHQHVETTRRDAAVLADPSPAVNVTITHIINDQDQLITTLTTEHWIHTAHYLRRRDQCDARAVAARRIDRQTDRDRQTHTQTARQRDRRTPRRKQQRFKK